MRPMAVLRWHLWSAHMMIQNYLHMTLVDDNFAPNSLYTNHNGKRMECFGYSHIDVVDDDDDDVDGAAHSLYADCVHIHHCRSH